MIYLLATALFCSASLYVLYLYKKETDKIAVRVRQKKAKADCNMRGTLVQDPVTGVYFVKR